MKEKEGKKIKKWEIEKKAERRKRKRGNKNKEMRK